MSVEPSDRFEDLRAIRGESLPKKRCECLQSDEELLLSFSDMVALFWSNDYDSQLEATTQYRKLLSTVKRPPAVVIPSGFVRRFVNFLLLENCPQLQLEAAWVLTNIAFATSEYTNMVIEHGAVPILVKLLSSPSDTVREQAVWALANLAGDSPQSRDLVLAAGALPPLLAQLLNQHAKHSMLRNAAWTLLNLCRGNPEPPFDQIRPALPSLMRLMYSTYEEVLTDACWALSYLSDGSYDKIQAVIEAGVFQRLYELLHFPSPLVLIPVLGIIGNIAKVDDVQIQCFIEHRVLPCMRRFLTIHDRKKNVKKEACRTISNIIAGNKEHIEAVIEADLFGPLLNLSQNAEFDIKKEAACAISNATSRVSRDQISYLVEQNCIKPLCDLLVCPESRIVIVCLEGLTNILRVGQAEKNLEKKVSYYAQLIDEAKGLEKIKNLQSHDNIEIQEKAAKILETYWLPYGGEADGICLFGQFKLAMVDNRVMIIQ